ncbi:MAG: TonB family protein [Treponema sp.]|jgi:protein TonB|nr:TonB family protein [Treponema sp.]
MRIRKANPLFLALSLSVFIHGLLLVFGNPRPEAGNRSAIAAILPAFPPERTPDALPETPQSEIPPVTESAAFTEETVPASAESATVPAEISRTETSEAETREFSSPVAGSFVRPGQSGQSDLREDAIARYAAMIHGLIDRRKAYPYQARRQDQEGSVQLRFTLSRHGALTGDPVIEKNSRYRLLNESALEAVKNAAPYPPFPQEIPEDEMSFQITVSFSL